MTICRTLRTLSAGRKLTLAGIIILLGIFVILYKLYMPHVNAFGCFDDCNNFMGGYFLLLGKRFYSEIFTNHQPLATYISAGIQLSTAPQNIYELILRHRQFIILFGLFFNALLILRFGVGVLLFTAVYEFTKFYLFGDRFLAEGMIVYPLVYMAGILLAKSGKKRTQKFDQYLAAIVAWFVVFSRLPYAPVAIFLLFLILWSRPRKRIAFRPLFLFIILSLITVFIHDPASYYFNVITTNLQVNLGSEFAIPALPGPRILQSFFYPLYIPFFGQLSPFRYFLIGMDTLFLILYARLIIKKRYADALLIFFTLGLANIRVVEPGAVFYSAFHMLVWYAFLIFISCTLIFRIRSRIWLAVTAGAFIVPLALFVANPSYFAWSHTDPQAELLTNYGRYLEEGEVVKALTSPSDSLFLDASDDLVYWQARRKSDYPYSWYTSLMPYFPLYKEARLRMFRETPPVMYREYGSCPKTADPDAGYRLPDFVKSKYVRLLKDNKPSCLFIRTDKISGISPAQWQKTAEFHYTPPEIR